MYIWASLQRTRERVGTYENVLPFSESETERIRGLVQTHTLHLGHVLYRERNEQYFDYRRRRCQIAHWVAIFLQMSQDLDQ